MKEKDYSISSIRLIAFTFIVGCHLCQYYQHPMRSWLNVGVQMFLFISGHLYGGGGKRTTLDFYINRVKKVLLPYYLTISTFLLTHVIFLNKAFTKIDFFELYICNANTTIQGGEHLWYIPLILLCYLLTPIFLDLINYNDKRKMLIIVLILCLAVVIFFHFFINLYFYNPAWIICYF